MMHLQKVHGFRAKHSSLNKLINEQFHCVLEIEGVYLQPLGWWWRIWWCMCPLGPLCSQSSCRTLLEGRRCWISCRLPDVTERERGRERLVIFAAFPDDTTYGTFWTLSNPMLFYLATWLFSDMSLHLGNRHIEIVHPAAVVYIPKKNKQKSAAAVGCYSSLSKQLKL